DHVLETDGQGQVLALRPRQAGDQPTLIEGVLTPGLVNAHCHLELSALKGQIPEGTGMTGFVSALFAGRGQISDEAAAQAVGEALDDAWKTGTVAIGDICNAALSISAKQQEKRVWTHSFIEILGLAEDRAEAIYATGEALAAQFAGLSASLTAHAPYSMSPALLERIGEGTPGRRSVHLLESEAERALFEEEKGDFLDFFEKFNLPYQGFRSEHVLDHITRPFSDEEDMLWVHLTEANPVELAALVRDFPCSYFCLCPRSNYFIHRRYPNLERLLPYADRICLGTDSLASNHDLDMVAEMRTIQELRPEISLHTLLKWTSTQGAAALGKGEQLGHFVAGGSPGIMQLAPLGPDGQLLPSSCATPLEG
ncbi:MAG: amidohydrolase family protein, partial [Bacteroidota bacterium]